MLLMSLFNCATEQKNTFEVMDIDSIANNPIAIIDNEIEFYPDCFDSIVKDGDKQGGGCGNAFLFKTINEGVITVSINLEDVFIGGKCRKIDLNKVEINLEVYRNNKTYRDSTKIVDYCSCIRFSNAQSRINAKFLSVDKIIASAKKKTREVNIYQVEKNSTDYISVKLTNLEFLDPISNDTIVIDEVVFYNVKVGWSAG
jgi:hypothetical protein